MEYPAHEAGGLLYGFICLLLFFIRTLHPPSLSVFGNWPVGESPVFAFDVCDWVQKEINNINEQNIET